MTKPQNPPTLLIDCDNTLVLSEHLAFAACATLINQILQRHEINKTFTGPQLQERFVGQNFRGMLAALSREYHLEIPPIDVDVLAKAEVEAVISHLKTRLEPAPGAAAALEKVSQRKPAPTLAVVSSSALRRVNVSLQKTGLDHFFGDRVYSAASSLAVPTSKPDPAIYLHAMLRLGVTPNECIAIEDSPSGTISAIRAEIPTLGYVGAYTDGERDRMAKALKDAGAKVIMNEWNELDRCLAEMGYPAA
ncbi:hypothetical protein CspHIS471_0701720 [Cutaneotrichosporon sp. HIS471]|nr:hypothetical protein CspHIS471_0701720 [Cutaneotrichosporon sp. HIS471]